MTKAPEEALRRVEASHLASQFLPEGPSTFNSHYPKEGIHSSFPHKASFYFLGMALEAPSRAKQEEPVSPSVLWRPQAGCAILSDVGLVVGDTGSSLSNLQASLAIFGHGHCTAAVRAQASIGGGRKWEPVA